LPRFGLLVRTGSQREGSWYGQVLRGRKARASGVGTWAEALSSSGASDQDERLAHIRPAVEERLECVAGILARDE
jgi:hypothetical protein